MYGPSSCAALFPEKISHLYCIWGFTPIYSSQNDMKRSKHQIWWIPVALGLLFLAMAVSGFFDPTESARNPYSDLELFAETPTPHTIQAWVRIFLGLVGVFAIIVIEFAFTENGPLRAISSPTHLFLFIVVCVGFLITSIEGARSLAFTPDLAHYYYARGGEMRDAAAISFRSLSLDPESWFLNAGSGLYCLFFSIENLWRRRLSIFLGVSGILLSVLSVLVFVLNRLDFGTMSWMTSLLLTALVAPVWMIGIGFFIRRKGRETSGVH